MACRLYKCIPIILGFVAVLSQSPATAIVNTKIDRIIDLSSQLVKITDRIHLDEKVGKYRILIEPSHEKRLAFIEAAINGQPVSHIRLDDGSYEVDLTDLSAKPLTVTSIYTNLLEPYPAEILQSERQLVRYQGLQSPLSPYLTKVSTTKIKMPSGSRLESFTKAAKMTTGTSKLTYGPFSDLQPNQAEPLMIHYENNSPFIAVSELQRVIEIKPWIGKIYVSNYIKVRHVGAKLKGPFSRIDYQRNQANGISSVRNFAAEIPKLASDIYFRDAIGNISTSTVKRGSSSTIVSLKPRFPLFGGWATDFNLGYTVPISLYINEPKSGNNYRLSIPFSDVFFENMFIEEAITRVILPKGSSSVEIKGSLQIERLEHELPVIVLKMKNVVAQHLKKPLIIRYEYTKSYVLLLSIAALTTIVAYMGAKLISKQSHRP